MTSLDAARERYLAENPFDPHSKAVPSVDENGMPAGFMTFPDMGELQILAAKLGMEWIAISHDDDAVEDWIDRCLSLVGDPELVGVLFANVFRGINLLLGSILDDVGLRPKMHELAVKAWDMDYSKIPGGSDD